jgi:hypothetical protein
MWAAVWISTTTAWDNCILQFPGCIGFADVTLCEIGRPYKDRDQRTWFNGSKKAYCCNNPVIIDDDGLLI